MSELIRLLGFALLGIMAYGLGTQPGPVDKTRFLIMVIVGLIMITIGYLGDIADKLDELKPNRVDPPQEP